MAPHKFASQRAVQGFTLIELVMVMVIVGVIGAIVSVFMKNPIDAYFASGRRAALTDLADTTVRRITRDIQRALPNSIGPTSNSAQTCIEFIPTKTGGRFRAAGAGALNVSVTGSTTFNMFGDSSAVTADQQIIAGDTIALYNMGSGQPGLDAYVNTPNNMNTAVVTAVGAATAPPSETPITITVPATFNTGFNFLGSTNRFQVVPTAALSAPPNGEGTVAYVCSGGNLYRVANASLGHLCPNPSVVSAPMLAKGVTCTFNYSVGLQHDALLSMVLKATDSASGESVSLQHEVHVGIAP